MASRKFNVRAAALTAATLGAVAISLMFIVPAAVAGPAPCQTKNLRTGIEYKGAAPLATAITAANAGDTISIWGTCVGNFEVGKDVTLKGQGKKRDARRQPGWPRADDQQRYDDHPRPDDHQRKDERIGWRGVRRERCGSENVLVTGNTAAVTSIGGGIEADLGSRLTLIDSAVSGNSAGSSGGIDMFRATASLTNSKVTGNHATRSPSATGDGCGFGDPLVLYACAGGIWNYQGTLALTNSTVTGNTAAYRGGGLPPTYGSSPTAPPPGADGLRVAWFPVTFELVRLAVARNMSMPPELAVPAHRRVDESEARPKVGLDPASNGVLQPVPSRTSPKQRSRRTPLHPIRSSFRW